MANEDTPTATYSCTTQTEITPITLKWAIENFSYHQVKSVGSYLQSSVVSSKAKDSIQTKWIVKAYPNGQTDKSRGQLGVFVYLAQAQDSRATASIRCSIVDTTCDNSQYDYTATPHEFIGESGFGWQNVAKLNDLMDKKKGLTPNDTLTLYCEINVLTKVFNKSKSDQSSTLPMCNLSDDYSDLFEKKLFSDVTLKAGDKKFNVHRNILAARSTVFAAMFSNNMKEKKQKFIRIVGMDKDVLHNMLLFIYSGKAPTDTNTKLISGLLTAADKYDLERLKVMCECILGSQLTTDNAVDCLVLAYLHNANELKATAMEFTRNNINAVMKSENWTSLVRNYPNLLNEVLEKIVD